MHTVDEPGRVASGIFALLVHLLFFGMLMFGISWQKKIVGPVMVDLWEELPEPVAKVSPPPPKIVEPPPRPAPEVKKEPPPPPPPKVEAPPKPTPAEIELREKLRKQKEEEEAKLLEEKKALEAEKRRLEEERRAEEETKRLEQEKLKREEEARQLEEKKKLEEQRRAEDLRREEERQQQEAQRKQREADEAKRRAEAAVRAAQQKLIDDWTAKIQAAIRGRVVVPTNMQGNPEARFEVVLLPGGEVLSATLRKSSGVPAYDAAVERAILAAQPLPVPPEPDLFQENFRELLLKFRPKD
ncbi:MAG: energy transducer TonB [Betaproteobacteria bacterium]